MRFLLTCSTRAARAGSFLFLSIVVVNLRIDSDDVGVVTRSGRGGRNYLRRLSFLDEFELQMICTSVTCNSRAISQQPAKAYIGT